MTPKKSNSSNNKGIRCKNMMYEQQVEHLPFPEEELETRIKRLKATRYAYIFHKGDINEKGELEAPHIHVMLCFKNARYINAVAAEIGDKPQSITKWDKRANNGFSYLLHVTDGASNKTKHDPSEVTANFDYVALVTMEIPGQIAEAKEKRSGTVKTLLDMLYAGVKTKREVEAELSGSLYGKYRSQIEAVWAKRLQIMAADWREKMRAEGKKITTIWIYGPAGTGKTSLAKAYARKVGQEYFVSGSSRDPFQGYAGEHTVIFDELRPKTMPYHDLLRMTDPYGIIDEVMAPARYADKSLACDLIIITTPMNPYIFYREIFPPPKADDPPRAEYDSFDQLARRLTLVVKADIDIFEAMEVLPNGIMKPSGTKYPNPFSWKHRAAIAAPTTDLLRDMVGCDPIEDAPTEAGQNPFDVDTPPEMNSFAMSGPTGTRAVPIYEEGKLANIIVTPHKKEGD